MSFALSHRGLSHVRLALVGLLVVGSGQTRLASPSSESRAVSKESLVRQPAVTQLDYAVNARIRPLLLFWIGRDEVGGGRITWREDVGSRAIELVVGSDPARAPRQINRWGFIREEFTAGTTRVLGVMKESNEESLEEAETSIERERSGGSTFKAVRTIVTGSRAVGGTMTIHTSSNLTYRQLDALLALIPAEPSVPRTLELPAGTQPGFLTGMTVLIGESIAPCRGPGRPSTRTIPKVAYVYKQTLYDLSLVSCEYAPELRTKAGSYVQVVKGKFQTRNRTTGNVTPFELAFGTSGPHNGRPVRIAFRPRWWLEFELLLDQRPAPEVSARERP
jgi:hypothetical protein